ncbi:MAG: glycoside hydrolase family 30 beta sandwich domain-containing protein [Ignavibacteriaceae bacterium]|jgi:glucosylceramidase
MIKNSKKYLVSLFILTTFISCATNPEAQKTDTASSSVQFWLTNPDKSVLFQQQSVTQATVIGGSVQTLEVFESQTFQSIDGFGCALTGGSAILLNQMDASAKETLLKELFATDGNNIGISYLRISIGASDLSDRVFTYDDLPYGQTDTAMTQFSLDPEQKDLIPILKQILAINPDIKILGSPWTAPVWMKTQNSSIGGSLKPQFYSAYAKYFVKYIQEMKANGIRIDAITIQNEPLYGGNNPSMLMSAAEQTNFIKNYLGPIFKTNTIDTKIIIYDHNADRTDYPITVMNDPDAKKYINGSAFHLYGGTIDDLSKVQAAHPDKAIYFTEMWVGAPGDFLKDINWHVKNLIIGGMRNWCRNVIEWNLASDPNQNPHTSGGCTQCIGAITLDGNNVTRNPAYYIIAHAAKFVRPGAVRIASTVSTTLPNVAFKTTDGKKVMIVLNDSEGTQVFKLVAGSETLTYSLKAGAVGTFVW